MIRFLLLASFLFLCAPGFAAEPKVEAIGALTEASVADAVKAAVEDKGWRVVGEDGKTLAELWFAKKVDTAGQEVMGANFGNIPEGTFLGVIHFPTNTSDYRGQATKAGFYTMRFALILQNGAHLGVSPARDFILLCPPGEDQSPARLTAEQTIKLSMKAASSGHPSPWSLLPATAKDNPHIHKTDEGHVVLEVKVGGVEMGITLIGKTEG